VPIAVKQGFFFEAMQCFLLLFDYPDRLRFKDGKILFKWFFTFPLMFGCDEVLFPSTSMKEADSRFLSSLGLLPEVVSSFPFGLV